MSVGQMFFRQSGVFFRNNPELHIFYRYIQNPWFYGAILFFAISTLAWVKILAQMKISIAYPLLSISYILTAIGAYYLFEERLSAINILGIFVIMIGVSLISIK
ncbi:MAG TPA: EamA family transporter [Candidatus Paceibacterota bacterium]|nr:EamA family transporter [Candidatus Paceibacterota bacterium]